MNKFDEIDKKILNILQERGRITNANLAAEVGLSPPPMLERVKKLEKNGVITRYVAQVDPKKVERATIVYVSLTIARHRIKSFDHVNQELNNFLEVLEIYHISGEEDYLIKVVVKDIQDYEQFLLKKLATIPAISRIKSNVVLSTIKHSTKIFIE
ncbi:MAG TPA: Lrp/AsnC family transcriptional regulator [bacterium]